jgi:hypothetical protein
MQLEIENVGEIFRERNVISDAGDFIQDKFKKARINRLISNFLEEQGDFARYLWYLHAPVGDTGALKTSGFRVGNVRKTSADVRTIRMGLQEVRRAGDNPDEWKYPLFVHEGTSGPIHSTSGNLLKLTNKRTGNVFAYAKTVRGQAAQPTLDKVSTLLNTNFGGIETYNLGRKIEKILKE